MTRLTELIGVLATARVGGALEGAWAGPKAAASGCWQRHGSGARSLLLRLRQTCCLRRGRQRGASETQLGGPRWPWTRCLRRGRRRGGAAGCTHTRRLAAVVGGAAGCTHTRRLAVVVGGAAGCTRTRRLAAAVGGDAGCTHTRRLAAVVSDEARCEQRRGHRTAAHHACRRGAPEVAHGLALGPHVRYALGPLHLPPEPRHVGDGVDACGTQRWCGNRVLQPRGSR